MVRASAARLLPSVRAAGERFDAIVVGAGIAGSCTAFELAKRGLRCLLLEQYDFGHRRGSSHGESRITRRTYAHPQLTASMTESYALWAAAEQEAGMAVYTRTGGLDFGLPAALAPVFASATAAGVTHERLSAAAASARFPAFRLPPNYDALYQSEAGVLNASKAVRLFQELARRRGAVLQDRSPLSRLEAAAASGGEATLVLADGRTLRSPRVVLAAGAWLPGLLAPLGVDVRSGLRPLRVAYSYWRLCAGASRAAHSVAGGCPVAIHYGAEGGFGGPSAPAAAAEGAAEPAECYLLPEHELPGLVKVSLHLPEALWGPRMEDPGRASCAPPLEAVRRHVTPFVTRFLPGLEAAEPALVEACTYTMTDDQQFVMDAAAPGVWALSPCSGHGFKFGPLSGAAMADLVLEGGTARFGAVDLSLARLRAA